METNIQPTVPTIDVPSENTPPQTPQLAVPVGAKIIAIIYYIASVALIFAGIMFILALSFISFLGFSFLNSLTGLVVGVSGVMSGVLILAWGIVNFIAGRGLWTGRQWGKYLAITISALYIVFGVIKIFKFDDGGYVNTFISIVLNLFFIFYLLASHAIKSSFQTSTKTTIIVLPLMAVAIYTPIQVSSFQSQIQMREFAKSFQEASKRTDQAIKDSNMDCKFYEYKNYDEKYLPLNTQSGNGIYSNLTYNFQINLSQAFTMKEFRGISYCENSFVFYKPEDTTAYGNGELIKIAIKPAEGDLKYIFDNEYGIIKSIQKTETQIAGQQALKILMDPNNPNGTKSYIVIYNRKLFSIFEGQGVTNEIFDAIVASLNFNS